MYEYIQLTLDYSPTIWGSEESTVEWIMAQLKERFIERLYIVNDLFGQQRNEDGLFYIQIHAKSFPRKGPEVIQWVLKALLQRGFEPFAANGRTIHLKRRLREDDD